MIIKRMEAVNIILMTYDHLITMPYFDEDAPFESLICHS